MRDLQQKNPFLLLSPFLLFFVAYVLRFHSDTMEADEDRYVQFARNLLNGFYSPPAPDIDLWCGPGYPLVVVPFIAVGLPLIAITLFNAVLQYLSIVLLYKSMLKYVSFGVALGFTLFWAFCYSGYTFIAMIHTETVTWFLVTLFVYLTINVFETSSRKYMILAGIVLGYTALTKIIFGYVMLAMLLILAVLFLFSRSNRNIRSGILIMVVAFITTAPYLIYTYTLTGRIFYWGNSGGMSLYWMSTPHDNEYGDWNNETFSATEDAGLTGSTELLKANHQQTLNEVNRYVGVEKDEAYKRLAIANIKANPKKFLKNIIYNISRGLFGFPYSYSFQRHLSKIWYFSILYTLALFSMFLTLLHWRSLMFSVRFLLAIGFIYLGGSSLLSMENRMFIVVVPLLIFWMALTLYKFIDLRHRPK